MSKKSLAMIFLVIAVVLLLGAVCLGLKSNPGKVLFIVGILDAVVGIICFLKSVCSDKTSCGAKTSCGEKKQTNNSAGQK